MAVCWNPGTDLKVKVGRMGGGGGGSIEQGSPLVSVYTANNSIYDLNILWYFSLPSLLIVSV